MAGFLAELRQFVILALVDMAFSCRLPTATAQVRARVMSCLICGGQSSTRACFLRALRFPLPILIPATAPHSSSSGAGSGLSISKLGSTPPPPPHPKRNGST
jgi:hypothetical protein